MTLNKIRLPIKVRSCMENAEFKSCVASHKLSCILAMLGILNFLDNFVDVACLKYNKLSDENIKKLHFTSKNY